jgi:hypothetical protein
MNPIFWFPAKIMDEPKKKGIPRAFQPKYTPPRTKKIKSLFKFARLIPIFYKTKHT